MSEWRLMAAAEPDGPRIARRRLRRARRRASYTAAAVTALVVGGLVAGPRYLRSAERSPRDTVATGGGRPVTQTERLAANTGVGRAPLRPTGASGGSTPPALPFGSHRTSYPGVAIRPSGAWTDHDAAVVGHYRRWQAAFVTQPCGRDWLAVRSPDADLPYVGEAQGWGMVITAQLAGADPNAQNQFDGILRWVLAHPSVLNPALHAAEQDSNCDSVNGGDSATDSDLDIAYGLLLADRQWGSRGRYDYLGLARKRIAAILRSEVNPRTHLLLAGDWAADGGEGANLSRSSDWMLGHFRAFRTASGDATWDTVLAAHQRAIATIQDRDSPKTGLLPDFVIDAEARPAHGKVLEDKHDGAFWWNACRVPWRLGTDAVTSADPRSIDAVWRMNRFAQQVSGGDPTRLRAGYSLAGKPLTRDTEPAFIVPFAVAAMVDRDGQRWLDALWRYLLDTPVDAEGYYPATIQLQVMLVLTGNWITPA